MRTQTFDFIKLDGNEREPMPLVKKKKRKNRGRIKRRRQLQNERTRNWVDAYKANHPCACGETDLVCLHLHHIGDDKVKDVSKIRVLSTAKAEVAKCIVLCGNCHAKGHAGRPRPEHAFAFPKVPKAQAAELLL